MDVFGVGKKIDEKLKELKIASEYELAISFPCKYVDFGDTKNSFTNDEETAFCGEVVSPIVYKNSKNNKIYAQCAVKCGEKTIDIVIFNNKYVHNTFLPEEKYIFYGKPKVANKIVFFNPQFEKADKLQNAILPFYPLKGKISQKVFRKIVFNLLEKYEFKSLIDEQICQKYKLLDYNLMLKIMHFPPDMKTLEVAKRRLLVERLFEVLMQYRIFRESAKPRVVDCVYSKSMIDNFIAKLPFTLTASQDKSINQIINKFNEVTPSAILLQGDVGCGKSVVAVLATNLVCESGGQVAVLLPTEVLCEQQYNYFSSLLKGKKVAKFSQAVPEKERKNLAVLLERGKIDVVVGTHSILNDKIKFANLKLAIIDEQHKFGVRQRAKLIEKGEFVQTIIMTATPIPRTLSLALRGDLEVVTIDEKPFGRLPIKSYIVLKKEYKKMFAYLALLAKNKENIYIVCPSIEENDFLASIESLYKELKDSYFADIEVGILHGKQTDYEKRQVLEQFRDKQILVLLSTTVIEVGIDIKDANHIVIMQSERFGLSQLHQLRGRVGRGKEQSYCYFCTEYNDASDRLTILKKCDNGFEIAEKDYKMRGGGEYLGTRQSGFPPDGLFVNLQAIDFVKKLVAESKITNELKELILN